MNELNVCSKCKKSLLEEDKFCQNCGFPERGEQAEKDRYNLSIKLKKNVLDDAEKKIKNVKILIYVLAGLNFLLGIYYFTQPLLLADGIGSLLAAIIFMGCAAWVNKNPLTGVLAAFIFWIILQLLAIFVDPVNIFSGIVLKIIFIGIFIKGVSSAKDAVKFTDQLKEMKEK